MTWPIDPACCGNSRAVDHIQAIPHEAFDQSSSGCRVVGAITIHHHVDIRFDIGEHSSDDVALSEQGFYANYGPTIACDPCSGICRRIIVDVNQRNRQISAEFLNNDGNRFSLVVAGYKDCHAFVRPLGMFALEFGRDTVFRGGIIRRSICNIQTMSVHSAALCKSRIIVPICNGGERWREAAVALRDAVPDPLMVAVVDSSSTDGSDLIAARLGFEVQRIDPRTFNHGRTRQAAVDQFCQGRDFAFFLTHDAVIEGARSLSALLDEFLNPKVGAAYGRQLPHYDAHSFGRHSASFLYPATGDVRALADAPKHGIRTAYISNSFAAYRIRALRECGGFPSTLILGEDTHVALHMLLAGWSISYCPVATVRHSHNYSISQEMQRYFDFGVLHSQLPELLRELGNAEGDGLRFVKSELRYMAAAAPWLLPEVAARNAAKYFGYRMGRVFRKLPNSLRRRMSMTKGYWHSGANKDGA